MSIRPSAAGSPKARSGLPSATCSPRWRGLSGSRSVAQGRSQEASCRRGRRCRSLPSAGARPLPLRPSSRWRSSSGPPLWATGHQHRPPRPTQRQRLRARQRPMRQASIDQRLRLARSNGHASSPLRRSTRKRGRVAGSLAPTSKVARRGCSPRTSSGNPRHSPSLLPARGTSGLERSGRRSRLTATA
jgi:hypothetical protein